ncbi:response regulator transcription factor (plasmid) [Sinorhizobium meliloti]|uniref:LuxR C-terminal-related transcriptional regulator n=1 Tax=Rhizobium meliloti TaxID=382 RepID=UPI000B5A33AE|nr:LuxR C-terminal-related transcriptional regulator [Sinorhizobium meliloti]ASJ61558.1 helix-turn-helix transcriptional regulator [Sinorhizobium meliloti]MCK3785386.1 response regulator transcription factor [Sinorhizobium meliloti]MCK3791512.1 response regulator transcription factor [Sinorhizobium meliloti]MCK3797358.1 response regulator transcription factor [Sinorhizobium meliloti]MDW9806796.1 DNA-binding response regulator [Sinorhizobium meliloti]
MVVEAKKAGAVDFIEKPFENTVIIEVIERASEHLVVPQADADEVNDIRARLQTLSERERQVLSAVVADLPNKSIAYDLDIQTSLRRGASRHVMAKMKAKSLPHLVRMALIGGFGPS